MIKMLGIISYGEVIPEVSQMNREKTRMLKRGGHQD
jgi:hypothetical protein